VRPIRTHNLARAAPEPARDSQKQRVWPVEYLAPVWACPTAPAVSKCSAVRVIDCPSIATHWNRILAGLPTQELSRLENYFRRIAFKRGELFYNIAAPMESVCFPLAGMICLFAVMHDGRTVVLAATGREGVLGVPLLLGEETASLRAIALIGGSALTLDRDQVARILPAAPEFATRLRRYSRDYLAQLVQIGACHALHSVSQRVARWLLMVRDRSSSDSLSLTHESLSEMLGCRRSSITESLSLLEKAGAIRGARGHVRIVDRRRLEQQSCECYVLAHERATSA